LPQLSQADDLLWAKRRVAQLETAATVVEEKAAVAENPGLSKSWRRTGERGGNRQLNKEHQITAEVFAGGYVKPLDGPSPAWDGWIQAHGDELLKWLRERGVQIRRDA
jgi:hypothetical protein